MTGTMFAYIKCCIYNDSIEVLMVYSGVYVVQAVQSDLGPRPRLTLTDLPPAEHCTGENWGGLEFR